MIVTSTWLCKRPAAPASRLIAARAEFWMMFVPGWLEHGSLQDVLDARGMLQSHQIIKIALQVAGGTLRASMAAF